MSKMAYCGQDIVEEYPNKNSNLLIAFYAFDPLTKFGVIGFGKQLLDKSVQADTNKNKPFGLVV